MEYINWHKFSGVFNRRELDKAKKFIASVAVDNIGTEGYFFDPRIIMLPREQQINMIMKIGFLPFSHATEDNYEQWVKEMGLNPYDQEGNIIMYDFITLEQWKNSPSFGTHRMWKLLEQPQILSYLLWEVAKIINKDHIPDIITGPNHSFVLCNNTIYDLLWDEGRPDRFDREFKKGKMWYDPIFCLKQSEFLTDQQKALLN